MNRKDFEDIALQLQEINREEERKDVENRLKKAEKRVKSLRTAYKVMIRSAILAFGINLLVFKIPTMGILMKTVATGDDTLTKSEQTFVNVADKAGTGLNHGAWTLLVGSAIAGAVGISELKKKNELKKQLPDKNSPFPEFEYFQHREDMTK